MTAVSITDFAKQFHDEIRAEASAMEAFREEVFVQKMGEILEDYGEVDSFVPASYKARGLKVDGYSFDDEFKQLTLVVSQFYDSDDLGDARLTKSAIDTIFNRVESFFSKSLKNLSSRIEVANEASELSSLIKETGSEITEVKLVLITDGQVPRLEADIYELEGVAFKRILWGIDRIAHFCSTGERESIQVDFSEHLGSPLPCVKHDSSDGVYSNYLAFIPGRLLADLYKKWKIRMLEMNVRVFLSARTKINRQIRDTIKDEPTMFCAYNNGVSAFAEELSLTNGSGGLSIKSATGFQIVNGGQTTASLYHTWKKNKADLDSTMVQMKITVVHNKSEIDALVPRISEYSNTQNKVQLADLAANQAPHPELQQISNGVLAPDPTGGTRQTYWFYERARGSYEEFRNLTAPTLSLKKQFDDLRPKTQRFDKLLFAKCWNSYLRLPHIVSLGGQKNFARFNSWLQDQRDENWTLFFKKTVALVLLWKDAERIVRKQKFKGYWHNIVAYTLAWLFKLTDMQLDLDKIWEKQNVPESVLDIIESMSVIVNDHIRSTDYNVTEWCKKEECWERLLEKPFDIGTQIQSEYITGEVKTHSPTISSEQEAIEYCVAIKSDAWFSLSKWLKERNFLTGKARSQCFNMGRKLAKEEQPSPQLSKPCKEHWEEATLRGWDWSDDEAEE